MIHADRNILLFGVHGRNINQLVQLTRHLRNSIIQLRHAKKQTLSHSHQAKIIQLSALIGVITEISGICSLFCSPTTIYIFTHTHTHTRVYIYTHTQRSNRIEHSLKFRAKDTKMKPQLQPLCKIVVLFIITTNTLLVTSQPETHLLSPDNDNATIYRVSKQLCWGCIGEALQFLFDHNLVRAMKWELPLMWDYDLEKYARWWANQRKADCKLQHSFPEDNFKLGENIFWGSGSTWTPRDAVSIWAGEEKYYTYATNTCQEGQQCGHYTQIVWKNTRRIGCARVVCDSGDVFMTCNYDPVGNYVGERPY